MPREISLNGKLIKMEVEKSKKFFKVYSNDLGMILRSSILRKALHYPDQLIFELIIKSNLRNQPPLNPPKLIKY